MGSLRRWRPLSRGAALAVTSDSSLRIGIGVPERTENREQEGNGGGGRTNREPGGEQAENQGGEQEENQASLVAPYEV